jgi:serine/threonine protein kinase
MNDSGVSSSMGIDPGQQSFSIGRGRTTQAKHKYFGKLTPDAIKLVDEAEALVCRIQLGTGEGIEKELSEKVEKLQGHLRVLSGKGETKEAQQIVQGVIEACRPYLRPRAKVASSVAAQRDLSVVEKKRKNLLERLARHVSAFPDKKEECEILEALINKEEEMLQLYLIEAKIYTLEGKFKGPSAASSDIVGKKPVGQRLEASASSKAPQPEVAAAPGAATQKRQTESLQGRHEDLLQRPRAPASSRVYQTESVAASGAATQMPTLPDDIQRRRDDLLLRLNALSVSAFSDMKQECKELENSLYLETKPGFSTKREECQRILGQIEERINAFEEKIIEKFSGTLGVSREVGRKIFHGAQSNWQGFYRIEKGIPVQLHKIPGFKITLDPATGKPVGQFGLKELGHGAYKAVKEFMKIRQEAQGIAVEYFVRLKSVSKAQEKQLEMEIATARRAGNFQKGWLLQEELDRLRKTFQSDVDAELGFRKKLGDDVPPGIAGLEKIEYVSAKDGQRKIRYVMPKYEGSMEKLFSVPQKNALLMALQGCRGALKGLNALKGKGIVHLDLKLANVLYTRDSNGVAHGSVSDFGLATEVGNPLGFTGSPMYMAPESFLDTSPTAQTPMDMFGFGMLLLQAMPDLYEDWAKDTSPLVGREHESWCEGYYRGYHEDLQKKLRTSKDPICRTLISPLISYNPQDRPTLEEATKQFNLLMEERERQQASGSS